MIIFKPDSVMRGIVGEIMSRFERVGFKIVAVKMLKPGSDHYHEHYEGIGNLRTRKGEDIFASQLANMQEGPVIAMVLEGVEAVDAARKMVGDTEPKAAPPGTIRGDYAHVSFDHAAGLNKSVANLVHASADKKEADQEIAHWFKPDELYDYRTVHEDFTQPKSKD